MDEDAERKIYTALKYDNTARKLGGGVNSCMSREFIYFLFSFLVKYLFVKGYS